MRCRTCHRDSLINEMVDLGIEYWFRWAMQGLAVLGFFWGVGHVIGTALKMGVCR
jgi:hypothetical protein